MSRIHDAEIEDVIEQARQRQGRFLQMLVEEVRRARASEGVLLEELRGARRDLCGTYCVPDEDNGIEHVQKCDEVGAVIAKAEGTHE
jgi:hypothetical protein